MAAMSHDEFVDLYDVMGLPTDADSETIRLRLNTLYLEAQQNLDHRNVKKRLQYQQMYEIYLPQGRHLLLDSRRRAEYDRYLNAYHTGNKVEPTAPEEESPSSPSGEISKTEEPPIPGMVEAQVNPEVLAAEREDMWAKWKVGLEAAASAKTPEVSDALSASAESFSTAPETVAANPSQPSAARPPAPRGYAPPRPGAPKVARTAAPAPRSATAGRPRPPVAEKAVPHFETPASADTSGDIEKHREQQRYALIKDAVQNAGLLWGAIYAGSIFLMGCILLFVADIFLKSRYPFGLKQSTFALIGFVLILCLAAIGGLLGRRSAKRRAVSELSMLSIEQLMRRSRAS